MVAPNFRPSKPQRPTHVEPYRGIALLIVASVVTTGAAVQQRARTAILKPITPKRSSAG